MDALDVKRGDAKHDPQFLESRGQEDFGACAHESTPARVAQLSTGAAMLCTIALRSPGPGRVGSSIPVGFGQGAGHPAGRRLRKLGGCTALGKVCRGVGSRHQSKLIVGDHARMYPIGTDWGDITASNEGRTLTKNHSTR